MQLVTKRDKITNIAQAWKRQYYGGGKWGDSMRGSTRDVWEQLKALSDATEPSIAAIIGNDSWTRNECTECGQDVDVLVQMGEEPDWESSTINACPQCLRKALELAVGA
jgi:hypothetical protein